MFYQAEDGKRYLVRSLGLGDVYKRQDVTGTSYTATGLTPGASMWFTIRAKNNTTGAVSERANAVSYTHLTLPTSDLV